ncbi:MAG: transposase, partial [Bacteroidota bacterium]
YEMTADGRIFSDGLEVVILDVRIVPPAHEGPGQPPLTLNEWLRGSLRRLSACLKTMGTNLHGCPLSVDAAYVSPENIDLIEQLEMHLVSKLSANRKVEGDVGGAIMAKVGYFAGLAIFVEHHRCRFLPGEDGVEYQRNTVHVPSLRRDVLAVTFLRETDFVVYFTTKLGMKTITLRNILRYRWQLERIFWILKQDIGIGDIHNQKENRVETRIYLHLIFAQVAREAANVFNCSPKDIIRSIRCSPKRALQELGFHSAFATEQFLGPVSTTPLAA